MKFKKLRIKNIRSYKEQEIIFPEGSMLLSGEIGSGKTSILLAIEYALFGLQPGQKGNALLRNNEDTGEVTLELEIAGRQIIIERKLKRTPKGVSNEYASIYQNGEKTESSVTEIKSKIVELLGYPPEFVKKNNILYRFTVHAAQEQMKQIILEDAETRINILRHVFGIDRYRQIKSNLTILVADLKTDVKVLQSEISTLEQDKIKVKNLKETLSVLEQKISLQKITLSEKIKKCELLEAELREIEEKMKDKRLLEGEIEKTKILLSTKRELSISLTREEKELTQLIAEIGSPLDDAQYQKIISKLKQTKNELEQAHSKYMESMAKHRSLEHEQSEILSKKERIFKIDICPTCLQDVSEHHKHNILNEAERKISEIGKMFDELKKEKQDIQNIIDSQKKEISQLEEQKTQSEILKTRQEQSEKAKHKLIEIEKNMLSLKKDQELLLNHIDALKERVLEYSSFDAQHKKKELEVRESQLEEKKSEISLAESEKELQLSKREIVLLEEIIQKKEQSKKNLHDLIDLIDWLSTHFSSLIEIIERNVLLRLRKEFSSLFQKWFLMLIPENSLDSHIDENFTPIILQGEVEMDYSFLSGGERTAVALAYRLALNQTINSLLSKIKTRGLIILDEPTDGFSDVQITKIRDILEELNTEQLIIVSHEQKIESFVDHVLRVSKEGDTSSVDAIVSSGIIDSVVNQKT